MWSFLFALSAILAYVGVWVLALMGLGWAFSWPVRSSVLHSDGETHSFHLVAWALLNGLLAHYLLVLLIPSLKYVVLVGGGLALVGFWDMRRTFLRLWRTGRVLRATKAEWVLLGLLALPLLLLSVLTPILAWDARSIWFFHARMIYVARGLSEMTGLQYPTVGFSHPDYPEFLPALAANLAFVRGFWNEYLPKAAVFFGFLPVILGVVPLLGVSFFLWGLFLCRGIAYGMATWTLIWRCIWRWCC